MVSLQVSVSTPPELFEHFKSVFLPMSEVCRSTDFSFGTIHASRDWPCLQRWNDACIVSLSPCICLQC